MAWYDLDKQKEEKISSNRSYLQKIKYDRIVSLKTKNFTDVIGDELEPNTQYRLVTEQAFNAIIVLEYLLKKYELTEIYIAIYRMNLQSVNRIKTILDKGTIDFGILLSSFFRENKKYEEWAEELIMYARGNEKGSVGFAINHAKVLLAKTKDNQYIVFEGSGNLSDNARIEQYLIENNETMYNFHKKWIIETLKRNK